MHENDGLNKVSKFKCFKSFLCDCAIFEFSVSPENYKEATDLLKQRYRNLQVLINSFMKKFVQFPAVQNSNNV